MVIMFHNIRVKYLLDTDLALMDIDPGDNTQKIGIAQNLYLVSDTGTIE